MDKESTLACLRRAADISVNGRTDLAPERLSHVPVSATHTMAVREVLDQVLCGPRPDLGLEDMRQSGALFLLHGVPPLVGFGGGAQGHKDLWEHTKTVVRQAESSPVIRWAALYHDVGKPLTIERRGGEVSFHHHEAASGRVFRNFCLRSGIFPEDGERIAFIIENLGRVESFSGEWTDSAVRRLMVDLGTAVEEVVSLSSADITTGRDDKRKRILMSIESLKDRMRNLRAAAAAPRLPKGLGTALVSELGVPKDAGLKRLMDELESRLRSGKIPVGSDVSQFVAYARDEIVGK